MGKKYKNGETLDVSIEKIVPNGYGLGFAENLTVFVPLSVAGDRLKVKIYQLKGKSAFAEIVEIIEPSNERIEPPCPYFGRCGGCNFQQMPYETQLPAKVGIVRDCLSRIGRIKFAGEIETISSPEPFHYRSRAQWHLDTIRQRFGYFERNSHRVIDVEECPILLPELEQTLKDLRGAIDWKSLTAEIVDIEAASASGQTSIFSDEILEPTLEITHRTNESNYKYAANIFFQGNPFLVDKLIETAISGAAGDAAIDLYCGVGLFTLQLAKKFGRVEGVEAYDRAVDFAELNAESAGIENVSFVRAGTLDFLSEVAESGAEIDFALLDPPRAGTEKGVIERLLAIRPNEISYVSCEPSILARDLAALVNGGYSIGSITVIDLFPQTHHVETVVRLNPAQ
ncbi:MAG: class I SAM-dependent RNA methyltransferase [Pyrinomonadaceae bacterium]|nr:class I SAM-dependent RNA methyltransferase [Pyrinomonadaceae bacterium]